MLLQSQKFALENIYCAPMQDRQYSFKLTRINKKSFPALRQTTVYGATKALPNTTSYFHIFTLGNLFPELLNLQGQKHRWYKDQWIKLSDDMTARNFIAKVYNDAGQLYPRNHIYYSYIDENSLIFALEVTPYLKQHFDAPSFQYLNVYSNAFFQSPTFSQLPVRVGIEHHAKMVVNNQEKANLQALVQSMVNRGGDVFVYCDGYFIDRVTLNVPDLSYVEIVYDQSVVGREVFDIQGLRTFDSVKDNKMKYLLYRNKTRDVVEYHDDCEVYVVQKETGLNRGLLLYRHEPYVMRNVTDKDYSLHTTYVNNTAQTLSQNVGGSLSDKTLTLYQRRPGRDMPLVYSAMKLHELYKLPAQAQKDALSNTNYTLDLYRVEQLENSAYFQVAGAGSVSKITPQLAIDAIGYNGITYAYANTPVAPKAQTVQVPELYQHGAVAFEYDHDGKYLRFQNTNGPVYLCSSTEVGYVDFVAGTLPTHYGTLYPPDAVIPTSGLECRILSAYFDGTTKQSVWEDITDNPNKCQRTADTFTVTETAGKKIKKVCLHNPRVYDLEFSLDSGNISFPLTQPEDRGNGVMSYPLDVPYENIEVFVNGYRLTQGLDLFMKFPNVSVCTKKYLDYSLPAQKLHIRMSGFTLDPSQINAQEIRGFINHGVLTRNRYYDIREDKVLSTYVDGKLRDRKNLKYSEEDHTVRITHPQNGLPYVLKEPFLPIKLLTGVDSFKIYRKNIETNKKISDFYNLVYPEAAVDEFNTIASPHYLFSPVISTLLNDILQGAVPESFYSTPYDDNAVLQLLDERYKDLMALDPVRAQLQPTLVEIHPHLGNHTVEVSVLQYRLIANVVRLITTNHPERVNLSGYLNITS